MARGSINGIVSESGQAWDGIHSSYCLLLVINRLLGCVPLAAASILEIQIRGKFGSCSSGEFKKELFPNKVRSYVFSDQLGSRAEWQQLARLSRCCRGRRLASRKQIQFSSVLG
ncbi:hypothetical protein L6452_05734 [Arctium lappa]|uniref:Uncharacterized protein n=1 Tax=Arctium lappa TaxID=4217 RepID=A0ACB9EHI4_ARCLA|nr:hypothetical protein L6452_05734 [Arctium lappa]